VSEDQPASEQGTEEDTVADKAAFDAVPTQDASPADENGLPNAAQWALSFVIAFGVLLLVRMFLLAPYSIPSASMEPTVEDGDRVLVARLSYGDDADIGRGEVVVFTRPPTFPGSDDVIKRVVGLPGETVRFYENEVFIGDLQMLEPYLRESETTSAPATLPGCAGEATGARTCVVPDGHVFVLGDNRTDSVDSRSFGPIPIDTIVGRAAVQIWPPWSVTGL